MKTAWRSLRRLGHRVIQTAVQEGPSGLVRRTRRVARRVINALNPESGNWTQTRAWFERFRPDPEQLAYFRVTRWPDDAPRFTVIMPVYNPPANWLTEAIQSVRGQVYPHVELICVNDGSTAPHVREVLDHFAAEDPRVRVIHLEKNGGVSAASNRALAMASGDFICCMDHDDALEVHALHRFARTILKDQPDLLYSDEVVTGEGLDEMLKVNARNAFSYDNYLSHPYFVHLVGMRTEILRRIGGWDESLQISQDVDVVLRVLEHSRKVSYIPDVLYRWRTHTTSSGHQQRQRVDEATRAILERHLRAIHVDAEVVTEGMPFNVRDVRFRHRTPARVGIIIPTKNQVHLLRPCLESIQKTVPAALAEVVVLDHQSDDPETVAYLAGLGDSARVIPYQGPFNFAAMMNFAVRQVHGEFTHYLLMNNDTAAIEPGWLEHMLGFGQRPDVGIVGAVLLYPDDTVQHAGVIIGLHNAAEHSHKFWRFAHGAAGRELGHNAWPVSNREVSAVTGACLLIRADVFDAIDGFDERLAVGFNDIDLCLRARELGYKIIQDAQAVLYHYESQTRGINNHHPEDTTHFCMRHAQIIERGDPFYSPLLTLVSPQHYLCSYARSPVYLDAFTTPVIRPGEVLPAPHPAALRKAG